MTGARFVGHNQNGGFRWWTLGTVVAATPDTHFAFEIAVGPVKVARWEYWFEDSDGACTVTEQWTDRRSRIGALAVDTLFGSRARINRRNMRKTLEAIKVAAER